MDIENGIFNLKTAMDQAGGDKELLRELTDIYSNEYPQQLQGLLEAIEKNNAEQVRDLAHTVKGAVGNFGAGPAYETALDLENIGKSSSLSTARESFDKLKIELKRLEEALTQACK